MDHVCLAILDHLGTQILNARMFPWRIEQGEHVIKIQLVRVDIVCSIPQNHLQEFVVMLPNLVLIIAEEMEFAILLIRMVIR